MTKKPFFIALLSISFLALAFSSPANSGYNGDTMEVNILQKSFSLFPRHYYTVEIMNNPQESESKFTMRLASYGEVSGCATMTPPYVQKEQTNDTIKLNVLDPQLRVNTYAPRYSPYDCDININRSFMDIEFDRDDLINRGIKHIALRSELYGEFFTSDLEINEQKIDLKTKTAVGEHLVTFWFFPQNTVILHTPTSKRGVDVTGLLREYGVSNGLVPIEETFEKFFWPDNNQYNYAFFTDPSGELAEQTQISGEIMIPFGTITPARTVYDATGAKQEPYDVTVYVSVPGYENIEEQVNK